MSYHAIEPVTGLASLALARGAFGEAVAQVETVLSRLRVQPDSEGVCRAFSTYLVCYDILVSVGDGCSGVVLAEASA